MQVTILMLVLFTGLGWIGSELWMRKVDPPQRAERKKRCPSVYDPIDRNERNHVRVP